MPSPSPASPAQERTSGPQPDRERREDGARSRSRSPRRSPPRRPKSYSGLKWKNDRREDRGGDRHERRERDRRNNRDDTRREARFSEQRGDRRRDDRRGEDGKDVDRRRDDRGPQPREPRASREKKTPASNIPVMNEAMIIVTVNDRLGTKTQVPCVPSDPVKVLKAMVAAKIGRPVHEIMLKRQGERPFHDSLTLADYSISNGVQIDLELNTGD